MSEETVYNDLMEITKKVFSEMIFLNVEANREGDRLTKAQNTLTGMVGFGGTITGLVAFHCSKETGAEVAAKMLYADISTVSQDDIRDAIGEITNMITGGYKAKYAETHHNGELVLEQTVPTVISGNNFETYVLGDATKHSMLFHFKEHEFLLELWLRKN